MVNAAGIGYILQYRQVGIQTPCSFSGHRPSQTTPSLLKSPQAVMQDLQSGEINFLRQSKICQAPITAFDVSADGTLLGVGTSEGEHLLLDYHATASLCVADSLSICECAAALPVPASLPCFATCWSVFHTIVAAVFLWNFSTSAHGWTGNCVTRPSSYPFAWWLSACMS